jgi:hypothetical protein
MPSGLPGAFNLPSLIPFMSIFLIVDFYSTQHYYCVIK